MSALSVLLISCETVGYYSQAARGQLGILIARRDIEALLADDRLNAELRGKLELVLRVREFAAAGLHLPVGDNYLSYVDLQREHAVWNVFAAPEFSVEPRNWCYPIAGCVSYRGYFSEERARRYARKLSEAGYDVYLGGIDAYSTLGWFDDPLFSTVIGRSDAQLAALIFHELAHRLVYVPGDTTFNESFATIVEREGVIRWLESVGAGGDTGSFLQQSAYQQQFIDLVLEFRQRFDRLYREDLREDLMRARKRELQNGLRDAYVEMKAAWSGYGGYDNWFAGSLNNAQLGTVASYNDLVPPMRKLLRDAGGELPVFYERIRALAELGREERNSALGVSAQGDGG